MLSLTSCGALILAHALARPGTEDASDVEEGGWVALGGWYEQLMGIFQTSGSPQSHEPPGCWEMQKETMWPVWSVA